MTGMSIAVMVARIFWNNFCDDMEWMALASLRVYELDW